MASMLVMQSCSTVNQNKKDGVIINRLEGCQYVMVYVKSSSDDYSIIRVLETQMKLTNDLEIFGNLDTEGYQTIYESADSNPIASVDIEKTGLTKSEARSFLSEQCK